ncbi:MAG: thiolase family protein [Thermodesulfobacteriota bacterium]
MQECVFIDGVRTPNSRGHSEKGWLRNYRPDELLTEVYKGLFEKNDSIDPGDLDALFVGCANPSGPQNDIGRLAWLASGYPDHVPSNTLTNQCPSGMAATIHGARAIISGEADIILCAGVEDMQKVPMGSNIEFPPRLLQYYNGAEIPMGPTAEKVAELWEIDRDDMENMAEWSHKKAAAARDQGKFANEILPLTATDETGNEFIMQHDQGIRNSLDREKMKTMLSPFKPDGKVTAATSSPVSQGACGLILMSRSKADELNLPYRYKYHFGTMAGCDPTVMGIGPIYSVQKLFAKTGLKPEDFAAIELNEAFASQSLACIRELGLDNHNAPFEKVNQWGGALALGHPLGESGARILITLLNILETDHPSEKYGLATLCGGFGNTAAVAVEKVN